MFRGPFGCLGVFLIGMILGGVLMPLAVIVGYPALAAIGLWCLGRGLLGRLDRPGEVAAVWMTYLGIVLIFHGIVICFDTALAGPSPTPEEKRFGTRLAYLGGAVAATAAAAGVAIDRLRSGPKPPAS